ncbi:hypothetical protein M5D96_014116, partial [Drosophila gunungcola]
IIKKRHTQKNIIIGNSKENLGSSNSNTAAKIKKKWKRKNQKNIFIDRNSELCYYHPKLNSNSNFGFNAVYPDSSREAKAPS